MLTEEQALADFNTPWEQQFQDYQMGEEIVCPAEEAREAGYEHGYYQAHYSAHARKHGYGGAIRPTGVMLQKHKDHEAVFMEAFQRGVERYQSTRQG